MSSLNRCEFIGNLGKDPELKYLPNGDAVANVSIACSERWKDKATGEPKERTEWVNLAFIGKIAEILGQYCKKGSKIYVAGKMTTRKWQDKTGQDRYTTEIRVDGIDGKLVLLDGKAAGGDSGAPPATSRPAPARGAPAPAQAGGSDDDDIPF